MRYLTFSAPGDLAPRVGVLDGDRIVSLNEPVTLLDLIRRGGSPAPARGQAYRTDEVRWHAPIPRPAKNVFCVGRNFLTHIEEGARARGVEGWFWLLFGIAAVIEGALRVLATRRPAQPASPA